MAAVARAGRALRLSCRTLVSESHAAQQQAARRGALDAEELEEYPARPANPVSLMKPTSDADSATAASPAAASSAASPPVSPAAAPPPPPHHNADERPDWVESWSRRRFTRLGMGLTTAAAVAVAASGGDVVVSTAVAAPALAYWYVGLRDQRQTQHSILRNFPLLGNVRWFLEAIRPEIRQYFVESDTEAVPFSRMERSIVYQRAKGVPDTQSFGTRADVYAPMYEWCLHSMHPSHLNPADARVLIGGPHVKQKYSSSIFNVSGMSYGALSHNAILALNGAAKLGNFSHNTGEGGISRYHLEPGGDLIWNVGSGYFGCRTKDGKFCPSAFVDNATRPSVKMIELKLSQGAKPAHGGVLPAAKVTAAIAEARGVPMGVDCISPLRHSAFSGPHEMLLFIQRLRELSGGKPVGMKLCVGQPGELAALVHAMIELDLTPDFITVDGAEGGTGAAPPEFSNFVGAPLTEGLVLVHGLLTGAGLRDHVRIVAAGKIVTGKGVVKTMALGADVTNSARAMMFALGCIQALKCNTGKCPTGVTSQDPELVSGLVPEDKAHRVLRFHQSTVAAAMELVGAMGLSGTSEIERAHIMRRVTHTQAVSYADLYPPVPRGSLLEGSAPAELQRVWDASVRRSDRAVLAAAALLPKASRLASI